MKRLETFLDRLPGSPKNKLQSIRHENAQSYLKNDFQIGPKKIPSKTHFEMPFDIFYAGQCYQSVPYSHEDYPRYISCVLFLLIEKENNDNIFFFLKFISIDEINV